ncbi:hypothetical protein ACVXG7_25010 [Enterobacter hormaechei]
MLNDFSPNGVAQLNLFDDVQPRPHSDALMKVLDGINHSGLGKVWFVPDGVCAGLADETGDAVTGIYHTLEGAAGCPFLTVEMTEGTCRQSLLYRSYR